MASTQSGSSGKLTERVTFQHHAPSPIAVTSITRVGTVATAVTAVPHGLAQGDFAAIAGADQAPYNSAKVKVTVVSPTSVSYSVAGSPATPATGTITLTYVSDPQGNVKVGWSTFAEDVPAEAMPISANERPAAAAIPALATETLYRFRIRVRVDLTDQMRLTWTARWPPDAPERTFEITGLIPEEDGRRFMIVDCIEA